MQANLVGQKLGTYVLTRLLGAGGMASVYESYQETVKRPVAIKVLPMQLAQDPNYVERFMREVQLAAALEHPHILPIYDYGTDQGVSYIVMRLLPGGALDARLRQHGKPAVSDALRVLKQIADALDYAHRRGIVHRDLKSSNVMFDSEGNAYLADFGIAKALDSTGLTATGQVVGTPSYMAPEQWRGEDVDGRADIYSFGVMTYDLLTGRLPFMAPTPHAMMYKHLTELAPPPALVDPNLPEEVNPILSKVLAKDPAGRYGTASAFVQELERIIKADSRYQAQSTGFFQKPLASNVTKPTVPPTPSRTSTPVPANPEMEGRTITPPPRSGYTPLPPLPKDTAPHATDVAAQPGEKAPAGNSRWLLGSALVVAALLLAVLAFFLFSNTSDDTDKDSAASSSTSTATDSPTPTIDRTATAEVALLATATDSPSPTIDRTETAIAQREATQTAGALIDAAVNATNTAEAQAVATERALLNSTATAQAQRQTGTAQSQIEGTATAADATSAALDRTTTAAANQQTSTSQAQIYATSTANAATSAALLVAQTAQAEENATRTAEAQAQASATAEAATQAALDRTATAETDRQASATAEAAFNATATSAAATATMQQATQVAELSTQVAQTAEAAIQNALNATGTADALVAAAVQATQAQLAIQQTQTALANPTATPVPPSATPRPSRTPRPAPTEVASITCAGLQSRLQPDQRAYVLTEPPEPNILRSSPGLTNSRRIGRIEPGESFMVLEGPICADGIIWWRVRTNDGEFGWTGEGGDGYYWTAPLDTPLEEATHISVDLSDCPDAPPSTFRIGDTVVVDFNDGGSLRVTRTPAGDGGSGDTIIEVFDNTRLLILDGPVCGTSGDRIRWRVRDESTGVEGWVSEGVPGDPWLCPGDNPECSN